jgi:CheY-like chemotaxis protein
VVIADDSPEDVELTLLALRRVKLANPIVVLRDGAEALDYLHRRGSFADRDGPEPLVLFLDIHMPKVDGMEVLTEMRADPLLALVPVVMLTSSAQDADILKSHKLGVNSYVVKPVDLDHFIDSVGSAGLYWALINRPPAISQGAG